MPMLLTPIRYVLSALSLTLATGAAAQAPAAAPAPVASTAPIVPGDARLDLRHLPTQPETYRCFIMQDGKEAKSATFVSRLHVDAARHRLTWVQVRNSGAGRTMTDSTVADLATLRPIYMSARAAGRMTMVLHFASQQVRASVALGGAPTKLATHAMPQPYFDSNLAEIVFRMLPLAPGLQATIPCYEYEEAGQTLYRVLSVREDYLLGPDERLQKTWLVEIDQDQKKSFTLWIDQKTRELLKTVYRIDPATSMVVFKVPTEAAAGVGQVK